MTEAKQVYDAIVNRPAPISSYEVCKGESPQGTHICTQRDNCTRFKPEGLGNFKAFWMAEECPNVEYSEEPAKTEW